MKSNNLWKTIKKAEYEETAGIPEFLRDQGEYLREVTSGKVYGRCVQIKKILRTADLGKLGEMLSLREEPVYYGTDDQSVEPLTDISENFSEEEYAFDICSRNYKFRLFVLTMQPYYPIRMEIDEDIAEEIKNDLYKLGIMLDEKETGVRIENSAEFEEAIRCIFGSKKAQYVISNLEKKFSEYELEKN